MRKEDLKAAERACYYGRGMYPPPGRKQSSEDGTLGAVLAGMLCLVLLFVILGCVAYPFTMCKEMPRSPRHYSEDKWWCYHCTDAALCGSRCW
jgi:hypothetical protein